MHIYDNNSKSIQQTFPVPEHVTGELKFSNLDQTQKINVIKYRFNLTHGKGKRKKKSKK